MNLSAFAAAESTGRFTKPSSDPNWLSSVDGQGKHVLVIDDEYLIRHLLTDVLTSVNFRVTTASNGQEGVNIFSESPDEFDLIILDMVMPVMDGEKVFKKVSALRPQQKVLICSGYNDKYEVEAMIRDGAIGLLAKPFNLQELFTFISNSLLN